MGRRNFVSVALDPLPEPAMRALLAGLVPDLPDDAVALRKAAETVVAKLPGVTERTFTDTDADSNHGVLLVQASAAP